MLDALQKKKKVLALHGVLKMKKDAAHMLLKLIMGQSRKSPEDVATTADVLNTFGCKEEAAMLRGKLVLVFMAIAQALCAFSCYCAVTVQMCMTRTQTLTHTTRCTHTMSCTAMVMHKAPQGKACTSTSHKLGTMHAYYC